MLEDIRNIPAIGHLDVTALNFVRSSPPCVFRRHFRQGLRSHIMEILDPLDVDLEESGLLIDGVKWFPKASPRKMFRIFRTRLRTLEKALDEIARVKIVERYLAPELMATSIECIVDYRGPNGWDLMLCGFQEYVAGEILDPWTILDTTNLLPALYDLIRDHHETLTLPKNQWVQAARQSGARFIEKIKLMITEASHIPDLAGAGNIIITRTADIRLVDINNISRISPVPSIQLDEKGYPVCDKSIEALSLIEEKVLGKPVDVNDKIYTKYLGPQRRQRVKEKEERFWTMKDKH